MVTFRPKTVPGSVVLYGMYLHIWSGRHWQQHWQQLGCNGDGAVRRKYLSVAFCRHVFGRTVDDHSNFLCRLSRPSTRVIQESEITSRNRSAIRTQDGLPTVFVIPVHAHHIPVTNIRIDWAAQENQTYM